MILIIIFLRIYPMGIFITIRFTGAPVSFLELWRMKRKKVDIVKICNSYMLLHKVGLNIQLKELETAYIQKHNLENITRGLATAKQMNIPMTFEQAKEADKNGIDIMGKLPDGIEKETI